MRRLDHFLFSMTLIMMYIAPRIPASVISSSAASKSSISLAIIALGFWALSKPSRLIQYPKSFSRLPLFVLWFSVYSIASTLLSGNLSNLLTAVQYMIYAYLSIMLFANYFADAVSANQIKTTVNIIVLVALAYGLGIIVSTRTGPIYPDQVLEIGRNWQGVYLDQGVGFGVNANNSSGIIGVFAILTIMFYKAAKFNRISVIAVLTVALFLTISRAGILGFMTSMIFVMSILTANIVITGRMTRSRANVILMLGFAFVAILISVVLFMENNPTIKSSLLEGFGLGETKITEAESSRINMWQRGLEQWMDSPLLESITGYGFRGTASVQEKYVGTVHNFFIAVLGDFGILGVLLFFVPYSLLLRKAFVLALNNDKAGIMGVWALVALLFMNMTEIYFYGVEYLLLLTIISLLIGIDKNPLASAEV